MTAGQNSIYINKNYHHHYPFSTGSINPNFFLPKSANSIYSPSPDISSYKFIIKSFYIWNYLNANFLPDLKKKKKKKSFSFSKMNLEQTICNTEDWFFFFLLKSGWKYFTHSHSHILPHLKKKLHTPSWKMEHFFWEEGRF